MLTRTLNASIDLRNRPSTLDHSASNFDQLDCAVPLVLQAHLFTRHHRRQLGLLATASCLFPSRGLFRDPSYVWRGDNLWTLVYWTSWRNDLVDVSPSTESPSLVLTLFSLKSLLLLRLYPHPSDRTLATGLIRLATNGGIITGAAGST